MLDQLTDVINYVKHQQFAKQNHQRLTATEDISITTKETHLHSLYSILQTYNMICSLPARRYASAGNSDRNVSDCPSVRHAPVLCQNEES